MLKIKKMVSKIEDTYYMQPIIKMFDIYSQKYGFKKCLNHLNDMIIDATDEIETLLKKRLNNKEIKNQYLAYQIIERKSFQLLLEYSLNKLQNQEIIKPDIFITSNSKICKLISDYFKIKVDNDVHKPYVDLVIYTLDHKNNLDKCFIFFLQTSLKMKLETNCTWKLLMEIATSDDCSVKDKYDISYNAKILPKICFATINFYDEINNPQQRGMLKFFDQSFIAKNINQDLPTFISPLSNLIDFVNENI